MVPDVIEELVGVIAEALRSNLSEPDYDDPKDNERADRMLRVGTRAEARIVLAALFETYGDPKREDRTVIDAWVTPAGERQEYRLVFPWQQSA